MDSTEKKLKVIIPKNVQDKIDGGEYILRGSQVRDNLGKIICNLESLNVDDDYYFSPNLFLVQNNYVFVSESVVSKKLIYDLDAYRKKIIAIENKLDEVIEFQINSLASKISTFNELFDTFQRKSKLSDNAIVFSSGVNAAAEIAANIDLYIKRYVDGTRVFHREQSYSGELYSEYIVRGHYKPEITKEEFSNFSDSKAFYFIYAFINTVNNINIMSLCLDKKIHPSYEKNLNEIRCKLVSLINTLINGLCKNNDIYTMCYSTTYNDKYHPIENLIEVVGFDSKRTINDLVLFDYPKRVDINYDENRISSLNTCISLVQEIDNLLSRSLQLSELNLEESPEISEMSRLVLSNE